MTRLLEKLINKLAKISFVGIEGADVDLRDNEQYVRKVIQKKGASKFKFASSYLKSDAEFILSLVENYPDILEDVEDEIVDRYLVDCFMIEEEPVDMLVFMDMCYQKNDFALYFFSNDLVLKYLDMLEKGETVKGSYHGSKYEHKLSIEEKDYFWIEVYNPRF